MKHIGIVGITAEGASQCYKTIVSEAVLQLGPNTHPEISVNNQSFNNFLKLQKEKDWDSIAELVIKSIHKLAKIECEFAIMPANSIHYAISQIQEHSPVSVLNMVDLVVQECKARGFKHPAILGVGITMADGLYEHPLRSIGIDPVIPDDKTQLELSDIIYNEIVPGKASDTTTEKVLKVISDLKTRGCDSVILGCTELPIIITATNSPLSFIDTTRLLATKALDYSLAK